MDDLFRSLPKIRRAAGDAEEVSEAAAFAAWRRAAGDGLRGSAVPFRLYRKKLVVSGAGGTWRRELGKKRPQLIFRLNSLVGQPLVTYIEFRVDPKTVSAERERVKQSEYERLVGEENALKRAHELDDAAEAIHDEDLRRRFLLAAGSCMNRQERK